MCLHKKVFNYLLDNKCCKACSLRFLREKAFSFDNIEEIIRKNNLIHNDTKVHEDEDSSEIKKSKTNPCCICLGLIQEGIIDNVVNQVILAVVQKYDTNVFTCSVSIPTATLIREHTLRLMVKGTFPEFYEKETEEIPLNKMWKWLIKDKLAKKLDKTFENSDTCKFSINVIMDYADNLQDLQIINHLTTPNGRKKCELYSRKSISNILANCCDEEFITTAKMPPEIPTSYITCKEIECKHNPVYIAGRYCKFSRELSQSPWIIDGVKTMETSVEELIFEQIDSVFNIPMSKLKFTSSGREDCDVRCLGKGRPFYIEVMNPHKTKFSFEELRQLEAKISTSLLIQVRDLQLVEKEDLAKVKEGEEAKSKEYVALCRVTSCITQEQIDALNNYGPVKLQQKTPIRVIHRRPLAVRIREISKMNAALIPGRRNLFKLHMVTQAGTYVKEFVHGDFGRSIPNVGSIINAEVDIVALDVIAINLDWPKEVNIDSK